MKQQLTAKLKLTLTPDEYRVLRQTQLAYRNALNFVSGYAFAHGKVSNAIRLQKETYRDIRSQFGIPAQMACNIPRQVGARNIALRTLFIRQDWMKTGTLSVCPDASDREAKVARLHRYAELRWSLDASPALEGWGD